MANDVSGSGSEKFVVGDAAASSGIVARGKRGGVLRKSVLGKCGTAKDGTVLNANGYVSEITGPQRIARSKNWLLKKPTPAVMEEAHRVALEMRDKTLEKSKLVHSNFDKFVLFLGYWAMGNAKATIARELSMCVKTAYSIENEFAETMGVLRAYAYRSLEIIASVGRDKLLDALMAYEVPEQPSAKEIKELAIANHYIDGIRSKAIVGAVDGDEGKKKERLFTAEQVASLHAELQAKMDKSKANASGILGKAIEVDVVDAEVEADADGVDGDGDGVDNDEDLEGLI